MTPETKMLANDLYRAGFRIAQYGDAVRAYLRSRDIARYEVGIALDAAGYESCQYTLQASGLGGWIVRAVEPL